MERVYEFLKKCGTYYLATVDEDRARVRPFGTIDMVNGRLYFQTGKIKEVSKQLHANPRIEICAFDGTEWLRISATAVEDPDVDVKKHMLDEYPNLRAMYDENDGNTEVFYLMNATAVFSSFAKPAETVKF